MSGSQEKVLVILLGWWKSTDRNLQNYAKIYERFGCSTKIYIAPSYVTFSAPLGPYLAAQKLLREGDKIYRREKCTKLIFHSFSNNGSLMYQACMRHLSSESSEKYNFIPNGAVFDSCPGSLSISVFLGAVLAAKISNLRKAVLFSPTLLGFYLLSQQRRPFLVAVTLMANYFLWTTLFDFLYQREHLISTLYNKHQIPQLYLYSEEDHLVDFRVIEKLAKENILQSELRRQSNGVDMKKFSDSGHCAHYMKHKEEYERAIEMFLDKVKAS